MLSPTLRRKIIVLLVLMSLAILAACSRAGGDNGGATIPLYSDVVTLEVAIEDDPDLDDLRIIDPQGISVDATGSIYVADEQSVKVYLPDGSPLRRMGRQGAGPGEFIEATSVHIGPTGYVAAIDLLWEANIYRPDGEFCQRSRYQNEDPIREYLQERGFTFSMLKEVVALGPDRLLIDLYAMDQKLPGPYIASAQLLYAAPDTLFELCRYVSHGDIKTGPGEGHGVPLQGSLLWCLLDGERIAFTETWADKVVDGSRSRYRLHVLDLATQSTDTITIPWVPEPLPPSIKHADSIHVALLDRSYEIDPMIQEIMEETDYYPPLKALRADQGILFGFHHSPADSVVRVLDEELAMGPHRADIVDLATGRLLARAEFPFLPEVIRDGRAYRLFNQADGLPAVHVYRIDRSLYELAVPTE